MVVVVADGHGDDSGDRVVIVIVIDVGGGLSLLSSLTRVVVVTSIALVVAVDAGGGGHCHCQHWWKVEGGRNEDEGLREIFEVCMFVCVCGYDYISILN